MKKLIAFFFAAVFALAQPSFSNRNIQNHAGPVATVKVITVLSSAVGRTMDKIAAKGESFVPSTCVTTADLKSILNQAKELGSESIRLSVVRNSSGNNCLVANYYINDAHSNLTKNERGLADSPFVLTIDVRSLNPDSTQPCCPRCNGTSCMDSILIKS